jgi:GH25 family lysozyme M1 (1,4-beta-N-acetylmuramidase)/LysM repeat protein
LKSLLKLVSLLFLSFVIFFSFGSSAFAAQLPNVDFIDVSHYNYQSGLPLGFYQMIKRSGVKGVVVKVSEGTSYLDPAAAVNIANARQAGLEVSAYHFARYTSNSSAVQEAKWFDQMLKLVGFNKATDGYVVIDIEAANLANSPANLTQYTNTFINEMKSLGYQKIDIYSSSYYYNSMFLPHSLIINKPWLASWPSNPVQGQPTANFSTGIGAWQWTSNYVFPGLAQYGRFDASEDFAGKYTNQAGSSSPVVQPVPQTPQIPQIPQGQQTGTFSIVDYMKANGMDSSFPHRAALARQYGIYGYTGTAAQNLALLLKLKNGVMPAQNINTSKITTAGDSEIAEQASHSTTATTSSSYYTIQRGDTLSYLAMKYHTTVRALASLNNIRNVNFIRTGQVVRLSGTVHSSNAVRSTRAYGSRVIYHVVRTGDTVSELAEQFGSSKSQIKAWNNLNSNYTIYKGKTIRVR